MNYALIFAGGTGQRMNTVSLPKQFLKVHNKEIIVHTIEHFEKNANIDGIVVVCVKDYIDFMFSLKEQYKLSKVVRIVQGGKTGQESIWKGLQVIKTLSENDDDVVLIHDGVRPLIEQTTIDDNIGCVKKFGTCVTVAKSIETVLIMGDNNDVDSVLDRSKCYLGRAPQSFFVKDIYDAHIKANSEGLTNFIDSSMLMSYYGYKIHTVQGPAYNIKVTTPIDFYMFKAMLDAEEYKQIRSE